jgi:hypothetical protein
MIVLTHDGRRLKTNCAVTKRRTLGATSHDANVLGHCIFACGFSKMDLQPTDEL